MSRNLTHLSRSSWLFGQAPRQPFSSRPHDDRAAVAEWLPAHVPGDVRADLFAAGRLSSLDTPEGLDGSQWVDEADWWYRTQIEAAQPYEHIVLEADGIDYLSAIYLDGDLLATHQGMFARQAIVLPPSVQAPGTHELAIRVWGAGALPRLPNSPIRRGVRTLLTRLGLAPEYFPDRMATPKAQYNFGWDFAPRVLATGIWDDIRLIYTRSAYIAGVHVTPVPLTDHDDPTPVRWNVELKVVRFGDQPLRVVVEVRDDQGEVLDLPQDTFRLEGAAQAQFSFDSPAVARWWPWDQGEPRLYCLTVRLMDALGVLDEVETVTGVRTVCREHFRNGKPWRFTINGRPTFLRGANWVPADILPGRIATEDYAKLIPLARSAGINFLRIWGGGIREKRSFWEQCNRLGMMAMQEFPLACAFLDHYPPDPQYLSVLRAEAEGTVIALRNHPSLIAWCGGNEISPRRERLPLRIISDVLVREDKTRPWIAASPSEGDVHDWDVWHGAAPWQALAKVRAPFMSEFGLQALPAEETVREMFPGGAPVALDHPQWAKRKLQADKLRYYAGPLAEANLSAVVQQTQRVQAAALQTGIEGCRLRREGSGDPNPCGGVAFWQWNEPWPVVSWSVVDRRGRTKAAYDMLTRSYQPLLIAARFERKPWKPGDLFRAEVWLVNDGHQGLANCWVGITLDGGGAYTFEGVNVLPNSAQRVAVLALQVDHSPERLELTCRCGDEVVAHNRYDLRIHLPPPQPFSAWLMRRAADLLLR